MSQIGRGAWPLVTSLLESAHWSWIDETSFNRYHLQMEQSTFLDTFYLTNDSFLARWQWSTASNHGTKMNVVLLKKILSQKWTNLTWYYKIPANVKLVTVTFPGSTLLFHHDISSNQKKSVTQRTFILDDSTWVKNQMNSVLWKYDVQLSKLKLGLKLHRFG